MEREDQCAQYCGRGEENNRGCDEGWYQMLQSRVELPTDTNDQQEGAERDR